VSFTKLSPEFPCAQHSPTREEHPRGRCAACTRSPAKCAGAMVVGLAAFSGSFLGSKLVASKRRYLVPPGCRLAKPCRDTPAGTLIPLRGPSAGRFADANRWVASQLLFQRCRARRGQDCKVKQGGYNVPLLVH